MNCVEIGTHIPKNSLTKFSFHVTFFEVIDMYNLEIKQRFLDLHPHSQDIFDHTRQTEERLGKDVAEMSRPEILRTLSGCEDARSVLDSIRAYTTWCQDQGVFPLIVGGCFRVSMNEL